MKIIRLLLGFIMSISLIIILLINSVEIVAYKIDGYFEHEYNKYQVTRSVNMSMEDLLDVTDKMMSYLRGEKDTLSDIRTTINNVDNTPFFNEREILHMEDVRNLFVGAIRLRYILFLLMIISVILAKAVTKADLFQFTVNSLFYGSIAFIAVLAGLTAVIAGDFSHYFVVFHQIFFHNDLWMLDPATDNLINIVPEGFFMDTALAISVIFACSLGFLLISGGLLKIFIRHKNKPQIN